MMRDRMMRQLIPVLLLAACAAGGCYSVDDVKGFLQQPRSPVSGLEYRVLPPDMISIISMRVPEINGYQGAVRPDGKINLPLLGEIYVADKTPREIEKALIAAAKKYYEEEQLDVAVQVVGYNSRRFYVFGQVARPGPVRWTGCDTLLDVLAQAQPTPLAWPERIIVIRGAGPTQGGYASRPSLKYRVLGVNDLRDEPRARDPQEQDPGADRAPAATKGPADTMPTQAPKDKPAEPASEEIVAADRAPRKMTVNLMAMVQHGDMANNILLQPNDIIYVQPNPFARVGLAIERVAFPIRAATDGLSDLRELQTHWKWIEDRFPPGADTRARLITRGG